MNELTHNWERKQKNIHSSYHLSVFDRFLIVCANSAIYIDEKKSFLVSEEGQNFIVTLIKHSEIIFIQTSFNDQF